MSKTKNTIQKIEIKKILNLFNKYFSLEKSDLILDLPINKSNLPHANAVVQITLPLWASDLGVGNPPSILVPKHCIVDNDGNLHWQNVDWWRAIFEMITCKTEVEYERNNGPIHSYASKLPKSIHDQFKYAWVNRIIFFLMRWVSYNKNISQEKLFGSKPKGKIYLTHDVDYVSKTSALRFKRSIFTIFNIFRSLFNFKLKLAFKEFFKLFIFLFSPGEKYWEFEKISDLENQFKLSSIWNFYGGKGKFKKSFSELIFDPSYKVNDIAISNQIRKLKSDGHDIGLHQGFHSWQYSNLMLVEKELLEKSLGEKINICRQHWLRFSFFYTWKAQEQAGFELDTTLGFNEFPGFRNGAAMRLPAWIASEDRFSNSLETLPMVLMDSHLFDYGQMDENDRKKKIDEILDEIKFVGGEATVIWHQRVFHPDYNWGSEYRYLLQGIESRGLQ
jgi:hypothetical protein